ncbi:MAG TPA: DUF3592 domain-containing protein [Pyrinomonadaceae bacterium]|nr:DUF3592 domain-containing protein [Pyrinomonadaceae bacterium]
MGRTFDILRALVFSLGFGGLGAAALLLAAFFWRRTRRFMRESVEGYGEVVGLQESVDDGSPIYAPVVLYTAADGVARRFVHHTASRPPAYSVGQRVGIRYHRERPADARMAGGLNLYLGAFISALIAAVFFLVALLVPLLGVAGALG